MKKMEQTGNVKQAYTYALSPGDPQNPNSFKVRKGQIGGYKDALSSEDIEFWNHIRKVKQNPFYQL